MIARSIDRQETSAENRQNLLKSIPKVDECLQWMNGINDIPSILVKNSIREVLEEHRAAILAGQNLTKKELKEEFLVPRFMGRIAKKTGPNVKTVINATGVVIHTNLGRSVLPDSAIETLGQVGAKYSNLEFDLTTGKRGSRYSLVEELICDLTGAEAALVVNNNAAAVLLVLDTLAKNREVIVSRGQLVEIGGSFRIPEVMAKSGAKLVEVGATNRTHLKDYERAVNEETALLLKVHASNFRIVGFTKEVPLEDLVELAAERNLLVMEDLGSGTLIDLSKYGLTKEPTVLDVLKAGVDVVTFSGDKLLGGPQAGLIIGKAPIIKRIKQNPLNRALRIDKFTLASLETILRYYFDETKAIQAIPTLNMLTIDQKTLEKRARRLSRRILKKLAEKCHVSVGKTTSRVGGGALPEEALVSWAVILQPLDRSLNDMESSLRALEVPVIGRIEDECFILDMRTVSDSEITTLAENLLLLFGIKIK